MFGGVIDLAYSCFSYYIQSWVYDEISGLFYLILFISKDGIFLENDDYIYLRAYVMIFFGYSRFCFHSHAILTISSPSSIFIVINIFYMANLKYNLNQIHQTNNKQIVHSNSPYDLMGGSS